MVDIVSGWTENHFGEEKVVIVIRNGDDLSFRKLPARFSMFIKNLPEDDRRSIERLKHVISAKEDDHGYYRVDFSKGWARKQAYEALTKYRDQRCPDLEILEADVKPIVRLLADNPSINVSENPRLCYFDIEVDSRHPIPVQKEGRARLLSWAIADDQGNSRCEVLTADTDEAETKLFEDFFEAVRDYDCLLAWFGESYDFEVMRNRAEWLRVKPGGKGIPWYRWTWLDHAQVFKKYNMAAAESGEAKESFALDHVAGYLLGEGKTDFDSSKTWEAWENDPERLRAYNLQDSELLPKIEEKTGLIALHLAVCHVCRLLPDTDSLNATRQGDGFLLRLGAEHGFRWPTKERVEVTEKFAGAFVMNPKRLGAIDNVHVCDFSGLYPSIIRTFNMSPETKIEPEFFGDALPEISYGATKPVPREVLNETRTCQLPLRQTFFRTDTDGMFRIALDTLVAKRAEYQAAMKKETPGTPEHSRAKRLQAAFKIVANSFYGILGSPFSRFFDVEIAEGVTQVGQWLLREVIEEAKERDLDPFYGDTDSVFIAGDVENMEALVSHMNETWPDRLAPWGIEPGEPMHIDLDFEKTFSRIIMISAKRYAGRFIRYKGKDALPDAAPEVKGLEFKRGDTIRLAREMQMEIVNELLARGKPFDTPLPDSDRMRAIFDRWKEKILHEELDADAVILSQSLSKPPRDYITRYTSAKCKGCDYEFATAKITGAPVCPQCETPRKIYPPPMHARVALQMQEDGHEVLVGNRIRYLLIRPERDAEKRKPTPVPVYTPGAFERIDREYYWGRVGKASARVLSKVYPEEQWDDSNQEKKKRELERRREEFRGVISDLPLFAHHDVGDMRDTTEGRTMRTRKKKTKTEGPSATLSPEDQRRIREEVQAGSFDASAYSIAYGVKADAVKAYARGIPRAAKPRRRKKKSGPKTRKKKSDPPVRVEIIEYAKEEDGGIEKSRRRRFFERLRKVIEMNPGEHPVFVDIAFRDVFGEGDRTKAIVPTGLKIATTEKAKASLDAITGKLSRISSWPA